MNYKHLEGLISSICGTLGGGVFLTVVRWEDELLKFCAAMLTALCAGAMGWIGQQAIKKIYSRFKNKKKDDKHDHTDGTSDSL